MARSNWPMEEGEGSESFPPRDLARACLWIEDAAAEGSVRRLATAALRHQRGRVRESAVEALGRLRDPRGGAAVVEALRDGDGFVRAAAVIALPKLLEAPAALPQLIAALRDDDGIVRARAVQTLVGLGDDRAVEPLLEMLRDEPPGSTAQVAAAKALEGLDGGRIGRHERSTLAPPLALWAAGVALFSLGVVLANSFGMGVAAALVGLMGFALLVGFRVQTARADRDAFFYPAGDFGGSEAVWLGAAGSGGDLGDFGGGDAGGGGTLEF